MRIISIEEAKDIRARSLLDDYDAHYIAWLEVLYNKTLKEILHDSTLYTSVGGEAAIIEEMRAHYDMHRRYRSRPMGTHMLYTFFLCYISTPPHPYKNSMNYVHTYWDECKNLYPDFHYLREWCHTYKYSLRKFPNDHKFQQLLTETPSYVLSNLGVGAYNKYLLSFIRPSEVNDSNLSYVPDENHLRKDVQVSTTIGKIIPRVVNDNHIAQRIIQNVVGKSAELKIAETAEECTKVYNQGPRSCMKGIKFNVEGYDTQLNPAAVYNTESVGIIYCERGGVITGRAVINKKTREYARYYGDSYFHSALKQNGYTENEGCLKDCYLQIIPLREGSTEVLLPFIDGRYADFKREGDFLKICVDGDMISESTSGLIDLRTGSDGGRICDHCEERSDPDYMEEVDGEIWCEYCAENEAIHVWVSRYDDPLLPASGCYIEIDMEFFLDEDVARDHGWRKLVNGEWEQEDLVYEYNGKLYTEDMLEDYGLKLNEDDEVCEDDAEDEAA